MVRTLSPRDSRGQNQGGRFSNSGAAGYARDYETLRPQIAQIPDLCGDPTVSPCIPVVLGEGCGFSSPFWDGLARLPFVTVLHTGIDSGKKKGKGRGVRTRSVQEPGLASSEHP